jgi:hypothetical protein
MRAPAVNRARLAGIILVLAGGLAAANTAAIAPASAAGGAPAAASPPPPVVPPAGAPDSVLHYPGTAQDLESGRLIYGEQHYVRYRSGRTAERVVLYSCPNGAPFSRKVLRYEGADTLSPDFELFDARQGQHAGLRSTTTGREVFYRENTAARESRDAAPAGSGWVADAGFDEFVRANWTVLMRGNSLPLQFLIPSRLDLHRFQVKRLRAEAVGGVPAQVIRLRLSGWLGLILPHIDAWYSDAGHVLLRYEGLSNLMDAGGDHYKVRISFPLDKREPGSDAALAAALAAPLRPCN